MKDRAMTEMQIDALQKAGNIAAESAVTALSQLIDEKIMIDITKAKTIKTDRLPKAVCEDSKFVVGINMLIPTDNLCSILIFFPYESALKIIDMFTKNKSGTTICAYLQNE